MKRWQEGEWQLNNKRTLIFDNVNGLEKFNLYIDQSIISPPEKDDNRQRIPYRNGSYNFDELIGHPTYKDREIAYICQILEDDTRDLELELTEINKWLLLPVKAVLQDTGTPDYHFVGECISVIPANNERGFCEITINFKCYPFKIWNKPDNNDWLWDDFDLEHGIIPVTEFELIQGGKIKIYNDAVVPISFTPTFEATKLQMRIDNITYDMVSGKESSFLLLPGNNDIEITALEGTTDKYVMTISMIREEL